jgi:hypothetical protein
VQLISRNYELIKLCMMLWSTLHTYRIDDDNNNAASFVSKLGQRGQPFCSRFLFKAENASVHT